MPRVTPAAIVEFIDQGFPELLKNSGFIAVPYDRVAQLRVLLRWLDDLDGNLWPFGEGLHPFLVAWEAVRNHIEGWTTHGRGYAGDLPGDRNRRNAVWEIREAFRRFAPALAVPDSTPGLEFIEDLEYRARLREDVTSAEATFQDGQFKAATVMAGSVCEALLLLAVQHKPDEEIWRAVDTLGFRRKDLELVERGLAELHRLARHFHLFSDDTLRAVELARDFRNLIHTGREQRKSAVCSPGTARLALAAMDLLIHEYPRRRADWAASPA